MPKRKTHYFTLTVKAPTEMSERDVIAAAQNIIDTGVSELIDSLRLPEEEQIDTHDAKELSGMKLKRQKK